MIHVVDFEKTAFSTPFRGVLPPSGPQIMAESGMGYPLLGTRETWVVSTVPLATVLPPHAPRSTPHDAGPAGSGRAQTLPRWLLPDTDRRIAKGRTRPDLDERAVYIQYVTETGDSCGKFKVFLPARRRSTVDHSLVARSAQCR